MAGCIPEKVAGSSVTPCLPVWYQSPVDITITAATPSESNCKVSSQYVPFILLQEHTIICNQDALCRLSPADYRCQSASFLPIPIVFSATKIYINFEITNNFLIKFLFYNSNVMQYCVLFSSIQLQVPSLSAYHKPIMTPFSADVVG